MRDAKLKGLEHEAQKAESGDGVLGEIVASTFPASYNLWEKVEKLPNGVTEISVCCTSNHNERTNLPH